MSKRRSSLASTKKDVSTNSLLESCLKDKSCAPYQNSISFVEVVAFLNKFQKFFSIPAISFADLEQALDYEQRNSSLPKSERVASKTLSNLYKSLLKCFGVNSDKFVTDSEINDALVKLLKKCRSDEQVYPAETVLQPLYEIEEELEVCLLTAEQKLCMLTVFIDALLDREDAQALTQNFFPDDLRITPAAVDSQMNKFWYFGDTYLFFERSEQPELGSPRKRRPKQKIVEEIAKANFRLFTASKLEVVCKTSGDWTRLTDAYKQEKNVYTSLSRLVDAITALENKRLKQEMLSEAISRSSSRIQHKAEEKKRQQELARIQRDEIKKREMEERRLLEEERLKNVYSQRSRPSTSAVDLESVTRVEAANTMSRQERLQIREQRKLEQELNPSKSVHSPASSSFSRPLVQQNGVNNEKNNSSKDDPPSSTNHKSGLPQEARRRTVENSQNSQFRESMYPSNRFSEADKSKIRDALGIEKISPLNHFSKPSSSAQLNGFELPNVKKYMKRPGEVQQKTSQRVPPSPAHSSFIWTPVKKSPSRYTISRPLNNFQIDQRQYITNDHTRVLDTSHSTNSPTARPIKYFVPVKQYAASEHDYSRNSLEQYSSEGQQEKEYSAQWNTTQRSFNR